MAKRVTQEDIEIFNNLYYKNHNYSETARISGFSATTVKKYIIPNYTPREQLEVKVFSSEISSLPDYEPFKNVVNWGELCVLTDEEEAEICLLWEELSL